MSKFFFEQAKLRYILIRKESLQHKEGVPKKRLQRFTHATNREAIRKTRLVNVQTSKRARPPTMIV
jgi:hypothetical protein